MTGVISLVGQLAPVYPVGAAAAAALQRTGRVGGAAHQTPPRVGLGWWVHGHIGPLLVRLLLGHLWMLLSGRYSALKAARHLLLTQWQWQWRPTERRQGPSARHLSGRLVCPAAFLSPEWVRNAFALKQFVVLAAHCAEQSLLGLLVPVTQ